MEKRNIKMDEQMGTKINKFLDISDCVDKLKRDKFLHEGRFNPTKSVGENLDQLMNYIKIDTNQ